MEILLLIKALPLPLEVCNHIKVMYKYQILHEKKYIYQKKELIQHLQYYLWLNKKLNKVDDKEESILKTIKHFDYYKISG